MKLINALMRISALQAVTLLAACLLCPPGEAAGLSLEECLTVALENHPSLRSAKGATRGAAATLEQTRIKNRATLGATGELAYTGDYQDWEDRAWSNGMTVTASKLLYDTGRNRLQKERDTESLKASRENERMTSVNVAAAAKKAYYDLTLKIRNRDVALEKLHNLEEHLKVARGLYEVGNSAFIEVTKAEADLASARVSLLKAESDIRVSVEDLRVAMGLETVEDLNPSTDLSLPDGPEEIDGLLTVALADRPDYLQALHTLRARELSVTDAARTSSPTVTGSLTSSFSDREASSAGVDYGARLSLNIPLLDSGAAAAAVEAAMAQLDQASATQDSLRQSITHDVRSAALSLLNAADRARSAQVSVRYAEDNLELARGRYEVGVGDALELSDAVSTLADSRYSYYEALYDAQSARSDLDKALGHLPPELSAAGSL